MAEGPQNSIEGKSVTEARAISDGVDLKALIEAAKLDALAASLVSPPKAGEPRAWEASGGGVESTLWFSESSASAVARNHGQTVRPLYANHEARGDGVRVKPLEWTSRGAFDHSADVYRILIMDGEYVLFIGSLTNPTGVPGTRYPTLAKAKAAAQLDYETRIRAALEAALPPLGDDVTPEAVEQIRQKAAPIIDAEQWEPLGDGRAEIVEAAAALIDGWTVATNSRHLHGWGGHTEAVVDMLVKRDEEMAAAIRSLSNPGGSE